MKLPTNFFFFWREKVQKSEAMKTPTFFLAVTIKNALERAAKLQGIAQSKNKKDLQGTEG